MKYFGISEKPTVFMNEDILPMAKMYWGSGAVPNGAELIGGYSDDHRAGALLKLNSGQYVCGNCGITSMVEQQLVKKLITAN